MSAREVRRFVDDLLRGRRTKPFQAEDQDVAELRTAISLRAARTGSGAPREEFVGDLQRRLAADLIDAEPGKIGAETLGASRRRFLRGASIAAAAATVGAVGEHLVTGNPEPGTDQNSPSAAETLNPANGEWRTVADSSDLAGGAVRAFDLGSIAGFVHRDNGQLTAVSGTCTHQGCQLRLDPATPTLDCPCHNTTFAVTGKLLSHQLPISPPPLPRFAARETQGVIQIYAPHAGG